MIVSARREYDDSYTLTRFLATGGYDGLRKALTMFPEDVAAEVDAGVTAGTWRRGIPGRTQVVDAAPRADLVSGGERRRVRARDLQGPLPGRARPPPTRRGRGDRGLCAAGDPRLHLRARRIRPRSGTGPAGRQRRLRVRGAGAQHLRFELLTRRRRAPRRRGVHLRRGDGAARGPRGQARISRASSRRSFPRSMASTASPPWSTTSRPCRTCRGSSRTEERHSPRWAPGARRGRGSSR